MNIYQKTKHYILKIVGESVAGGFGRAGGECHLDPVTIGDSGAPYLDKFLSALAILKLSQEAGLQQDQELKEIALYLVGKLSGEDLSELDSTVVKEISDDAMEIFESNWYLIYSTFKSGDEDECC